MNMFKTLIPAKEQKPSIGLDIGVNSCKMAEIIREGESFKLVNWAIEPITNGDRQKSVRNTLRKLSSQNNSPKTAILGKGTLIRYINMPRMSIEDLKKSFTYEADKYFPFPQDQIFTDCFIIDPKAKDNKMTVLLAAAKKELINARIELLSGLGLSADFISLNPIALINVINTFGYNNAEKKKEDTGNHSGVAFLDMGEIVSNLTILVDNKPQFTRDIYVGGREITKSISSAKEISYKEAEKLKCKADTKSEDILKASESVFMNLVSELRLSFDYFITEHNTPVSSLLITGGASLVKGLPDILSKYLEIDVNEWNPIGELKLSENIEENKFRKSIGKMGVALGLALTS